MPFKSKRLHLHSVYTGDDISVSRNRISMEYMGVCIDGTPIAVDYWHVRTKSYIKFFFLSHCHTDHMEGLTSTWSEIIYCSEISAKLLPKLKNIKPEYIKPLILNVEHIIPLDDTGSHTMTVTLNDAHHCPGSVIFTFEGYFGLIVYTGDFRYESISNQDDPYEYLWQRVHERTIDQLFIDTTYLTVEFPGRDEAINKILSILNKDLVDESRILIPLRNLGKEDLLIKIANYAEEYIGVSAEKMELFQILELDDLFRCDSTLRIQGIPFNKQGQLFNSYQQQYGEGNVIMIVPSALYLLKKGLELVQNKNVYYVPDSDHSCRSEILNFINKFHGIRKICPLSKNSYLPEFDDLIQKASPRKTVQIIPSPIRKTLRLKNTKTPTKRKSKQNLSNKVSILRKRPSKEIIYEADSQLLESTSENGVVEISSYYNTQENLTQDEVLVLDIKQLDQPVQSLRSISMNMTNLSVIGKIPKHFNGIDLQETNDDFIHWLTSVDIDKTKRKIQNIDSTSRQLLRTIVKQLSGNCYDAHLQQNTLKQLIEVRKDHIKVLIEMCKTITR